MDFSSYQIPKQPNKFEHDFMNKQFNDFTASKIYDQFLYYLLKRINTKKLNLSDVQLVLYLLPKLGCFNYKEISKTTIAHELGKTKQSISTSFKKLEDEYILTRNSPINSKEYKFNDAFLNDDFQEKSKDKNLYYKCHTITINKKYKIALIKTKGL